MLVWDSEDMEGIRVERCSCQHNHLSHLSSVHLSAPILGIPGIPGIPGQGRKVTFKLKVLQANLLRRLCSICDAAQVMPPQKVDAHVAKKVDAYVAP